MHLNFRKKSYILTKLFFNHLINLKYTHIIFFIVYMVSTSIDKRW